MKIMKAKLVAGALLICATSLAVGQAQVIDAGGAADITTLTAKIEAVDQANRTVTVRGKMGRIVKLKVGPQVKNFTQVKVGDDIVLKYAEALSIKLEKGAADRSASYVSAGPVAAPAGAKPGVAAEQRTVIVATVQGKDPLSGEMLLEGPNGGFAEVKVKDSNVFNDVQVGDNVKVTYTEALVIDVMTPAATKK
jgi:hypothetical protein